MQRGGRSGPIALDGRRLFLLFFIIRSGCRPVKAQLQVRVIVLHDDLGLEPILGVPLEPYDVHRRVLRAVIVDRLAALKYLHCVLELTDPAAVGHRENLDWIILSSRRLSASPLARFLGQELVSDLCDEALGPLHHVVPTFTVLRLVLSELLACLRRLFFKCVQRAALEHTASLLSQARIKANFSVVFPVPVSLHHADVLPGLPGAIQVTDTDKVELLVLEAQTNLLRLFNAELSQLAAAVPLNNSLEICESLPVPYQPEINHRRLHSIICCHS